MQSYRIREYENTYKKKVRYEISHVNELEVTIDDFLVFQKIK